MPAHPVDNAIAAQPTQDRWGRALDQGFVVVPVALLRHQKTLGLDDGAMLVMLNILSAWWYRGTLPFPSTHTIAKRMGVSMRTVQRHLGRLEKLGLLLRLRNELASEDRDVLVTKYDPTPLVARLEALREEEQRTWRAQRGERTSTEDVVSMN